MVGVIFYIIFEIIPVNLVINCLDTLKTPLTVVVLLMAMKHFLEDSNIFKILTNKILAISNGNTTKLFNRLFILLAIFGALISNDATVIIFTPMIINILDSIQDQEWKVENKIPFLFMIVFVANSVALFVISNPINLIMAKIFKISFIEYFKWMAIPSLISLLLAFLGLKLIFKKKFIPSYNIQIEEYHLNNYHKYLILLLCLAIVLFFLGPIFGVTIWKILLVIILLMLIGSTVSKKSIDDKKIIRILFEEFFIAFKKVNWDVLIFVSCIYVMSSGLRNQGLTGILSEYLYQLTNGSIEAMIFIFSYFSAIFSAFVNNHPVADTMMMTIKDLEFNAIDSKILGFASIIGGDLGPKIFPTGSLAVLLWMKILSKYKIKISFYDFFRIGFLFSLFTIFICSLILFIEYKIFI